MQATAVGPLPRCGAGYCRRQNSTQNSPNASEQPGRTLATKTYAYERQLLYEWCHLDRQVAVPDLRSNKGAGAISGLGGLRARTG
jgi:hypothetical protein